MPHELKRETLLDSFRALEGVRGEALVYDDGFRPRHYTYEGLIRAARNFAARLEAAGIGRGDRVILWSENRPAWVAAFWGCVLRGVAIAPIDERHSLDFLERVAAITAPKAVLVGDEVTLPAGAVNAPAWRLAELDWTGEPPAFTEAAARSEERR